MLQSGANDALKVLSSWTKSAKLAFNARNTEALFFGKKTNQRKPLFKLAGKNIRCSDHSKYLGVTINSKLNFAEHVKQSAATAKLLSTRFGALGIKGWGFGRRHLAGSVPDERKAEICALRAAKAYRTVPTEAALVLAGLLPMDIRMVEIAQRRRSRTLGEEESIGISGHIIRKIEIESTIIKIHP
ncbi:PREDICTED: uncharacterized protein LOC108560788 [Nicrophorus vespilloides]|uniref:Uncharacterized protein LOC108560788 n=1 Tax=Nicrophorus vespilloides TaxID=110193 RepID=A0ABM1MHA7_NICVS|nr:PREDICTED: uncharacterized protein LOC108560788 [Nicrophorus vespilloides]